MKKKANRKKKTMLVGYINLDASLFKFRRSCYGGRSARLPLEIWKTYHEDTPIKIRITVEEL